MRSSEFLLSLTFKCTPYLLKCCTDWVCAGHKELTFTVFHRKQLLARQDVTFVSSPATHKSHQQSPSRLLSQQDTNKSDSDTCHTSAARDSQLCLKINIFKIANAGQLLICRTLTNYIPLEVRGQHFTIIIYIYKI